MKEKIILLFMFLSVVGQAQIQIGNDIDGAEVGNQSATSISLSADGSILATGARFFNNFPDLSIGHVRVFENQNGNWVQIGDDILGETAMDQSGGSVRLSGDGSRVAIGSAGYDGVNGNNAGHIRVFENQGGTWVQVGQPIEGSNPTDSSLGAFIHNPMNQDGSVIATYFSVYDPVNETRISQLRVYEDESGTWVQKGSDITFPSDNAWDDIDLDNSGDTIVIGVSQEIGANPFSGAVRVFEFQSGDWVQKGQDIFGEDFERIGLGVSLNTDGNWLCLGGINAPSSSGSGSNFGVAKIYQFEGGQWVQIGQNIEGENSNDQFGWDTAISDDGSIVAFSSINNSNNGTEAGHTKVYKLLSGDWVQVGVDIEGEAAEDRLGFSIGLSADGSILAIGAPRNDGNGLDSGHVRVFDLTQALAVTENEFANQVALYPNPATTSFTVKLPPNSILDTVDIYNVLGSLITTSKTTTTNVTALNSGVYFVAVKTQKGTITKKLIIN